jgi:DNA-binding MarR family transcriptional regulator
MQCLCAATRLAARAITKVYEAELRKAGLQAPQFWLLMEIAHRQPVSQSELLKGAVIDQTTLSRNLAVVVKHGWVACEVKGRQRVYSISKSGRAKLERAKPKWMAAQERMKAALGPDWEAVRDAVARIATAVEQLEES